MGCLDAARGGPHWGDRAGPHPVMATAVAGCQAQVHADSAGIAARAGTAPQGIATPPFPVGLQTRQGVGRTSGRQRQALWRHSSGCSLPARRWRRIHASAGGRCRYRGRHQRAGSVRRPTHSDAERRTDRPGPDLTARISATARQIGQEGRHRHDDAAATAALKRSGAYLQPPAARPPRMRATRGNDAETPARAAGPRTLDARRAARR
jgi:hypothetical protein